MRYSIFSCMPGTYFPDSSTKDQGVNIRSRPWFRFQKTPLGSPFDLVSRVSKLGYGDSERVSTGYQVYLLSQKNFQVKP